MGCYKHLSAEEREDIMCLIHEGISQSEIAIRLGRSISTVNREIARNSFRGCYRASTAQKKYVTRRKKCVRPSKLSNNEIFLLVADKFLNEQWSPEQIEIRLRFEGSSISISDTTIYRGIHAGMFDQYLPGHKKASRKLRHKGKRRRKARHLDERRGKFEVPARINERPRAAEKRSETGHWESDTVAGVVRGACIVTNVDRMSGFAIGGKASKKGKNEVAYVMKKCFSEYEAKSCTPDCGKEFAGYSEVSDACGVKFYFAYPRHPWERGSNENFNGLLREYFPKGIPIDDVPDNIIQAAFDKINLRPRKRHGGRTPYEVYYSTELHLI